MTIFIGQEISDTEYIYDNVTLDLVLSDSSVSGSISYVDGTICKFIGDYDKVNHIIEFPLTFHNVEFFYSGIWKGNHFVGHFWVNNKTFDETLQKQRGRFIYFTKEG